MFSKYVNLTRLFRELFKKTDQSQRHFIV